MESHTNPWSVLLEPPSRPGEPLHARLTRSIREAIREDRLPGGGTLPPSRRLAGDLGCSRWIVVQAYEQLVAEGYLESRVGSATRVRRSETGGHAAATPALGAPGTPRFDLAPGLPDLRAFPRRAWLDAMRAELSAAPFPELGYPPPGGLPRLREVVAGYLRRVRGAEVRPGDVTITSGTTDGMTRLWPVLADGGIDSVGMEDPGWARIRQAAVGAGMRFVPIPMDELGMRTTELRAVPGLRAAAVTPAHQFPTGTVLAPLRRSELLEWARDVDGVVLEDDYDAEYRYDRRPVGTVQGIDPARVVLLGSLSKTLAPAVSIGWIVAPPRWTEALRAADRRMTGPSVLVQIALCRFIESGAYDRHLRAMRQRYRVRRDRVVAALARELRGVEVSGVAAGLHLLVRLPPGTPSAAVTAAARQRGVAVLDLADCEAVPRRAPRDGLVLGYGNLDDGLVDRAVSELAAAVADARSGA